MSDIQEYSDVVQEVRGALNPGRLKLQSSNVIFKNIKTGKIDQYQSSDVEKVHWLKRARGHCLKFTLNSGVIHRYDGFKEGDFEKLSGFVSKFYNTTLEKHDMSVKGWNWGITNFSGNSLEFTVDQKLAFEVPLNNVSHSTTAKSEVTLEFHPNDDAAVSLMELRFHIPTPATNYQQVDAENKEDPVQIFFNSVLDKADIIQATGDALTVFTEIQCLTPRGRYDFKIYPTFLQLHGKTFDYKIPYTTVLRLFLLPHKDGRQMFFVVSLDPPIKQGQTRYNFIILLFNKDDEMSIELSMTAEDLDKKYDGKLQPEMGGLEYEVISRVFKAVTNRKITVPGTFVGQSGTNAISCSYKAATGFLYPLERGFIFIHKPPMHIRFDEVASVNFARSAGSTRSFDFDVETKSGNVFTFVGIEKDEYGKLYDFVSSKKLRVKNIGGKLDAKKTTSYAEDMLDSDEDDDHDAYLERMKDEGKDRYTDDEDDDTDSSDESYNPGGSGSEVAEEYDSNPPTTDETDSDESYSSGPEAEARREKKRKEREDKREKKAKKKSSSAKTVREPGEKRKKKKSKKDKDPNKPKRPLSSYFLWFNANREKIKSDFPELSMTETSKKAGELWKELTDKSEWDKKAEEAKEAYKVAIAEYEKTAAKESDDSGDDEDKKDSKKKRKSSSKSPKKVTESRAGAGGDYKSKEFISSSESSDSDKPLKKKSKQDKKPAKKKKEEESEEEKSSSAGELPEDEEILDTPPSSGKGSGSSESETGDSD